MKLILLSIISFFILSCSSVHDISQNDVYVQNPIEIDTFDYMTSYNAYKSRQSGLYRDTYHDPRINDRVMMNQFMILNAYFPYTTYSSFKRGYFKYRFTDRYYLQSSYTYNPIYNGYNYPRYNRTYSQRVIIQPGYHGLNNNLTTPRPQPHGYNPIQNRRSGTSNSNLNNKPSSLDRRSVPQHRQSNRQEIIKPRQSTQSTPHITSPSGSNSRRR